MFEALLGGQTKLDKAYAKIEELDVKSRTLMQARDIANKRADNAEKSMVRLRADRDKFAGDCKRYVKEIAELEESLNSLSKVNATSTKSRKKS